MPIVVVADNDRHEVLDTSDRDVFVNAYEDNERNLPAPACERYLPAPASERNLPAPDSERNLPVPTRERDLPVPTR